MKVRDVIEIHGIENVKTVKELVLYANQLVDKFGEETEYNVGGYDWCESLTIIRNETDDERIHRELINLALKELRRCREYETHIKWLRILGQNQYSVLIHKLNEGE